jgi:YegS/Rv2252/BmrU family lipid kinase
MKICLIVNPHAGGFSGFQKMVAKAAEQLARRGHQVEQFETTGVGEAIALARRAADEAFDIAVAVGGDGTINEICNGLTGTDTALGVLPAGTGNVFAAEVGIPIWGPLKPLAVSEATEIILSGQRRKVDLGKLQLADGSSRYFLMWCGVGLDAAINQARRSGQPRPLGYASWVVASLIVAVDFMGTPATLITDHSTVKKRVLLAVASNGQLYGRIWRMAPEAKMDDGLLDVAVMSGHGWPSTVKHLAGLTFRRHVKDPNFDLFRTSRLSLTAKEPLPVHVDSENVGTTPVEIEVAPAALKVIVPRNVPARLFRPEE